MSKIRDIEPRQDMSRFFCALIFFYFQKGGTCIRRERRSKEECMGDVYHGSTFSRSLANEQKKGAYYTDTGMCTRIGKLFKFPEGEEVTVLEPSVGDASAVRAVLSQKSVECNTPLYAVELDHVAAENTKRKAGPEDYIIEADFVRGVRITPGCFGFCFSNPPYGEEPFLRRRYEQIFVDKIYTYLKKDGILALVVPHYLFTREREFVCSLVARFEVLAIYRFDDEVYKQFQQVCVVARRRPKMFYGFGKEKQETFIKEVSSVEKLPYLPHEVSEDMKVEVPAAKASDIKVFATDVFDVKAAGDVVGGDSLDRIVGEKVVMKPYTASTLNRPPIPPKKDSMYLCATAGAGQGLCGSADDGDLHLQRGVVKVIKESEIVRDGTKTTIVEHSRSSISLCTIENDGTVRMLT